MFRKGIVVACHPEDNSVDLVMCDDGARLSGVPVMAHSASARSGSVDMPEMPNKTGEDKWNITKRHGQDMEALVAVMGRGNPIVVGFLYPQISQMTFKDAKRKFTRHQSDVYHTIDGDGNVELYHPSGAYVRIAEKLDHEDLEKKNFDESLVLDRNKDKKVGMRVSLGGVKIDIKDGVVTIDAKKVVVSGDVVASGVSLKDHVHTGVRSGPNLSGPPVGGVNAGAGSAGGGAAGAASSPGDTTKGTIGNGIAADAVGIYRQAGQTRVPYRGEPNFTGVTGVTNAYEFRGLPKRPDLIDEETYYARVRPAAIGVYGGVTQGIVSEFDPATETWTDDVIDLDSGKVGVFEGSVVQGIQDFDVSAPFEVYESAAGNFYAKYCNWTFVIAGGDSVSVGTRPVFWKLTEDEYP